VNHFPFYDRDDRDVEDMEDDVDKKKLTSNVVEGQ